MESQYLIFDNPGTADISAFLNNAGNSVNSFRYFDKRPLSIIENHLVTCLIRDEAHNYVGYGHLDKDGDTVWLGIAVAEETRGKGLGKMIMSFLVKRAKDLSVESVQLSVDKTNTPAIHLYLSFGFAQAGLLNEKVQLMKLTIA
ncbi:GNAT family N-acetyltransferase [Cryomorpha ignava]|uniref:GNAT family N-acetyltransferase n=1 Tax=Cryomorpha ignava TaxID=101383 RepID=A0A7K3WRG8_9FLAO|nr:GNAT family N-acetyltransferase [Cryomorpha ignava]NEN23432.1 GNAT family N-acetyltransferase [Cryomorpha ignava]